MKELIIESDKLYDAKLPIQSKSCTKQGIRCSFYGQVTSSGAALLGRWIYGDDRIVEGFSDYARIIKSSGTKYTGHINEGGQMNGKGRLHGTKGEITVGYWKDGVY